MAVRVVLVALVAALGASAGCSPMNERGAVSERSLAERHSEAELEPAPRILPGTHLAAGRMLEGQGDIDGAIGQYERAISANPRFALGYNRLGILYQRLGRTADAVHILRQGIRADPGAAILHNNLGYCYLEQKWLGDAEKEFREALVISPEFQRARMNLAVVLARRGRPVESLVEFSRVVPADTAHYNLAMVRLGMEDYEGAATSLHKALEINPRCPGAKKQLDRVAAILEAIGGPEVASRTPETAVQTARGRGPVSEPVEGRGRVEAIPLAGTADPEGTGSP